MTIADSWGAMGVFKFVRSTRFLQNSCNVTAACVVADTERGMKLLLVAQIRNRHLLDEVFAQDGYFLLRVNRLRVFSTGILSGAPTH